MSERALSFGSVAADYDRFRPGYPDRVVELVRDHADGPVRTALEIGAGTGKATVVVAGQGIEVLATEPDAGMISVLTERVAGLPVTVRQAAFEDVGPEDGPVDLVFAAAALHWTDPATRWDRVASLLRPGGVFAAFGGHSELADAALYEQVEAIEEDAFGPEDETLDQYAEMVVDGMRWPAAEIVGRPDFADVTQSVIHRTLTQSAEDFVGRLTTVSQYVVLPDADREAVLARIRALLPEQVEVRQDVYVHLARRAG